MESSFTYDAKGMNSSAKVGTGERVIESKAAFNTTTGLMTTAEPWAG